MITNRYKGNCETCTAPVNAGDGAAVKTGSGWKVRCAAHAPSATRAPRPSSLHWDDDGYDAMKDAACVNGTWHGRGR